MACDLSDLLVSELLLPVARAEDAVARLDERVRSSPVGRGYDERAHFNDAVAALWLEGELVHLEDLVLHDAMMDVRSPTHELTRAHAVVRARRRVAAAEGGWATSRAGLEALGGREEQKDPGTADANRKPFSSSDDEAHDGLSVELAQLDAAIARSSQLLAKSSGDDLSANAPPGTTVTGLAETTPEEEDEVRISEWRRIFGDLKNEGIPPVLLAALAWDAWQTIDPSPNQHWLGNLMAADILRGEGKTAACLLPVNAGLRSVPWEKRRSRNRMQRVSVFLDAITEAARSGLKQLDRLALARAAMERRLGVRRSNSHLPELMDLVLLRPMVSAGMIAKELQVTQRAALNLIGELGIREITGRGRFRAWGIF